MVFDLAKIDWNAISAISTFSAVLVVLFYQPFMGRRKLTVNTGLKTESQNVHLVYVSVTNRGEKPIWIVSSGIVFEDGGKKVVKFLHGNKVPKKLEPSEVMECPIPVLEYNYAIRDVFAKDSLGKFWYLKGKDKREFFKSIQICKDHNPDLGLLNPTHYVERPRPK